MPSKYQNVEIPIQNGRNQKITAPQSLPKDLHTFENGVFDETGRIVKRDGFIAADLSNAYEYDNLKVSYSTEALGVSKHLLARGDEVLVVDDESTYQIQAPADGYDDADNTLWAKERTQYWEAQRTLFGNSNNGKNQFCSYAEELTTGGVGAVLVDEYGDDPSGTANDNDVVLMFYDISTGAPIIWVPIGTSCFGARAFVTDGQYLSVFYMEGNVGNEALMVSRYDMQTIPDASSPNTRTLSATLPAVGATQNPVFDAWLDGTNIFYAHSDTAGIATGKYDPSLGTHAVGYSVATNCNAGITVSVNTDSTKLAVWWWSNSLGYVGATVDIGAWTADTVFSTTPVTGSSSLVAHNMTSCWLSTTVYLVYYDFEEDDGGGSPYLDTRTVGCIHVSGATDTDKGDFIMHAGITHQAFLDGNYMYLGIGSQIHTSNSIQNTQFIYAHDVDSANLATAGYINLRVPVARVAYGLWSGWQPHNMVSHMSYASDVITLPVAKRRRVETEDERSSLSVNAAPVVGTYTADFAQIYKFERYSANAAHHVRVKNSIYIVGGFLHKYDGNNIDEQGWLTFPERVQLTASNGSGSLTVDLVYSYRVYHEYYDTQYERVLSTYKQSETVDLGAADDTVTLEYQTPAHTRRVHLRGATMSALYRTAGTPANGDPLYRIVPNDDMTTLRHQLLDESFVDGESDANLTDNELALADLELDPISPPSPSVLGVVKHRIWAAGGDCEPGECWFSKLKVPGRSVEFNDTVNRIRVSNQEITGIANLNDQVVVFTANEIWVISGSGPNNLGQGFFSEPVLIHSGVGSIVQKVITEMDAGVLFASDQGYRLLGKDLSLIPVGEPVLDLFEANTPKVATHDQANRRIFICDGTDTLTVWDYQYNAWGTWVIANSLNWIDVKFTEDKLFMLDDTPTVYVQDSTVKTDATSDYSMRVRFNWIHFGGQVNSGYVKYVQPMIYGLEDGDGDQSFNTTFFYDYDDTTEGATPDLNPPAGFNGEFYAPRIFCPKRKVRAFQVEFEDNKAGTATNYIDWGITGMLARIKGMDEALVPGVDLF